MALLFPGWAGERAAGGISLARIHTRPICNAIALESWIKRSSKFVQSAPKRCRYSFLFEEI